MAGMYPSGADTDALDAAIALRGDWRHLTCDMLLGQREAAADAVIRHEQANVDDGDRLDPRELRWWRHACVDPEVTR